MDVIGSYDTKTLVTVETVKGRESRHTLRVRTVDSQWKSLFEGIARYKQLTLKRDAETRRLLQVVKRRCKSWEVVAIR